MLTTLHNFDSADGSQPRNAPLVQATNGDFYGETSAGGKNNYGTIFKITPGGEFTSLHTFDGAGYSPTGALVQATDGNLYGTTEQGGWNYEGTAFKITPGGSLTVLGTSVNFGGYSPEGVIQATDGNFYGTTMGGETYGGSFDGYGTVFTITAAGTLTTLHSFQRGENDGAHPYDTLLQATNGSFYGTTSNGFPSSSGVSYVDGTIFSLSVGLGPFVSFLPASRPVGGVVEILGQGFTGATGVSFNGTPASFAVRSDTYLTATVPAGAITGSITVAETGGTLTSNKIFRVTPQISSFEPSSGPAGTTVVITGDSLAGATEVTFPCGKKATFTVDSDTQITATVPAGAMTGEIGVYTPGGNVGSSTVFTVTP